MTLPYYSKRCMDRRHAKQVCRDIVNTIGIQAAACKAFKSTCMKRWWQKKTL